MKHLLSAFSILTALLFVGCDKQVDSSSTEPPIAIELIAPAVTDQMVAIVGDRFLRIGNVRYDATADVYHVEVFCENDDKNERRFVMEFVKTSYAHTPNLLNYNSTYPVEMIKEGGHNYSINIDELMGTETSSRPASSDKLLLKDMVAPGQTIVEVKKHLGEPSSVVTEEDGRIVMTYTATHDLLAAARSSEVQKAYSGTVVFKDGVVESSKDMYSSEIQGSID